MHIHVLKTKQRKNDFRNHRKSSSSHLVYRENHDITHFYPDALDNFYFKKFLNKFVPYRPSFCQLLFNASPFLEETETRELGARTPHLRATNSQFSIEHTRFHSQRTQSLHFKVKLAQHLSSQH